MMEVNYCSTGLLSSACGVFNLQLFTGCFSGSGIYCININDRWSEPQQNAKLSFLSLFWLWWSEVLDFLPSWIDFHTLSSEIPRLEL